eukprot:5956959-Prymnesium_polylepis.1
MSPTLGVYSLCRHLRHRNVSKLPTMRYEQRQQFDYTEDEAIFCDEFDWRAAKWEDEQQRLIDGFEPERCDCCNEFRPGWMANFDLHTIGDDWLQHEKRGSPDTRARLVQRYVGQKLCAQCRSPDKDELGLGILRFS